VVWFCGDIILLESRLENYEKDLQIKSLESKITELKSEFEKLKETQDTYRIEKSSYDFKMENHKNLINTQDQRINDINLYLVFWGTLITVILIVVFFKSKDEAKEVAKDTAHEFIDQWIEKKAMPTFNEKIDDAIDVEINEYIGPKIEKIEALLKDIEEHKFQAMGHANEMDKLTQEVKKQLGTIPEDEVKKIEAKDDRKMTAQEHYKLGLNAFFEEKYNTALNEFQTSGKLSDKNSVVLENALYGQGLVYIFKKEYDEFNEWVETIKNKELKTKLLEALEVFKTHGKE